MGAIILKWPTGRNAFQCAGDKVSIFLGYTDAGSNFVFRGLVKGDYFPYGIFAFKVIII